jgi:hypothetical protein
MVRPHRPFEETAEIAAALGEHSQSLEPVEDVMDLAPEEAQIRPPLVLRSLKELLGLFLPLMSLLLL